MWEGDKDERKRCCGKRRQTKSLHSSKSLDVVWWWSPPNLDTVVPLPEPNFDLQLETDAVDKKTRPTIFLRGRLCLPCAQQHLNPAVTALKVRGSSLMALDKITCVGSLGPAQQLTLSAATSNPGSPV